VRVALASLLYFGIVFGGGLLRNFATPAGAVYAVLLLLFAMMPWLVNRRRRGVG